MRLDDLLKMSASTLPQLQAGMVTGAATPPAGEQALAQIRARLDRGVPADEYMTDAEFAELFGSSFGLRHGGIDRCTRGVLRDDDAPG